METVEGTGSESTVFGTESARNEQKRLEKRSINSLGPGCREFESRHSDQISTAIMIRNGIVKAVLIIYLKALIYKAFL